MKGTATSQPTNSFALYTWPTHAHEHLQIHQQPNQLRQREATQLQTQRVKLAAEATARPRRSARGRT